MQCSKQLTFHILFAYIHLKSQAVIHIAYGVQNHGSYLITHNVQNVLKSVCLKHKKLSNIPFTVTIHAHIRPASQQIFSQPQHPLFFLVWFYRFSSSSNKYYSSSYFRTSGTLPFAFSSVFDQHQYFAQHGNSCRSQNRKQATPTKCNDSVVRSKGKLL